MNIDTPKQQSKQEEEYEGFITEFLLKIQNDNDVIGAMLFGSYIKYSYFRDIDIAVFLKPELSEKDMIKKRLFYLKNCPDILDIQIYNLLPLTVQKEVLGGRVLFETKEMYDLVFRTIREYEDFEHYLIQYKESALS